MKLTGFFKRCAACLCTAALLAGSASAFALTPAEVVIPAGITATNSATEAQLRAALSGLTVTYDTDAKGWQIDSPYEDASLGSASCGLYPYLFLTQDDPTVYITLGMSCFSSKKIELKAVRVETKDSYYDFTCDDQYDGGYDKDLKAWFDFEFFDIDDEADYLNEWVAAKDVTATFTGRDGTTKTYALTRNNLQAIRDIMTAYNTLADSDVSTAQNVLRSLAT